MTLTDEYPNFTLRAGDDLVKKCTNVCGTAYCGLGFSIEYTRSFPHMPDDPCTPEQDPGMIIDSLKYRLRAAWMEHKIRQWDVSL